MEKDGLSQGRTAAFGTPGAATVPSRGPGRVQSLALESLSQHLPSHVVPSATVIGSHRQTQD